jgi:hypothetical protein
MAVILPGLRRTLAKTVGEPIQCTNVFLLPEGHTLKPVARFLKGMLTVPHTRGNISRANGIVQDQALGPPRMVHPFFMLDAEAIILK